MSLLERWGCPRCPRRFLHARYLRRHLEDFHGHAPVTLVQGCTA